MLVKQAQVKNNEIEINFFGRDKGEWTQMLSNIKSLPGRTFDANSKRWKAPRTEANLQSLRSWGFSLDQALPEIEIAKEPEQYIEPWKDLKVNAPEYLRPYQVDAMRFLSWSKGRGILASDMGCISGKAIVSINRAGAGKKISLEKLYKRFHGEKGKLHGHEWDLSIPTQVRCLKGDQIGLHPIRDVLYQGKKEVIELITESGKKVRATSDHEFYTESGWIALQDLNEGDFIFTNGTDICINCKSSENLITYKYARFRGFCKKCMQDFVNWEKNPEITKHKGGDGYIYLHGGGLWNHPRYTSSGLLEHVYIIENHIGRALNKDEQIHHINKIRDDNRLENLEILTISEHTCIHEVGSHFGNFTHRYGNSVITIPKLDRIVSKIKIPELEDVYDIVMEDPYRNFIANGFIVHNCGKTIMALGFLQMTQSFPALIVVPATIKTQWQNQFKKFLGDKLKVEILWGQTPYQLRNGYTYIINWDILLYWKEALREIEFKTLIADEAHRAGNSKSKRTSALRALSKHIPNFIPMSGTPIKSRPAQFYSVLNMLDPEIFKSEWNFLQKYCGPKHNGFGWTFTGATNLPELYKIIRPYMLRQEKKDILKDLPPRQVSVIPLDISENKEYYEASLQKFKEASGLDAQAAFSNLKLEAFALKQDFLVKWLEEFIETGEKILVGTYHRRVIEFLYEKFKGNCRYIYGGMTPKQREEAIQTFIQKDSCQILFGQILAAGEGIDGLQEVSSNVAFVEFANTPADHDQFASRLHRSGQKDSVNEYYLIASGTVEDDMVESLNAKNKTFEALVNGREVEENAFIDIVRMKIKGF